MKNKAAQELGKLSVQARIKKAGGQKQFNKEMKAAIEKRWENHRKKLSTDA